MKLIKKFLMAPAVFISLTPSLLNAADLNLNELTNYSQGNRVESRSNFSSIYESDWSYKALSDLITKTGCKAILPSSSLSRLEAASLLKSCLNNVSELNQTEQRLISEFSDEISPGLFTSAVVMIIVTIIENSIIELIL